jgi:hypothetical protein
MSRTGGPQSSTHCVSAAGDESLLTACWPQQNKLADKQEVLHGMHTALHSQPAA